VISSGKTFAGKRAAIVFETQRSFADFPWLPADPAAVLWHFRINKKKAGWFLHMSLCARCADLARSQDYQDRNCSRVPPKFNFAPTQWELVSICLTGANVAGVWGCSPLWPSSMLKSLLVCG
jgi:hypothetical protein